MISLNEKNYTYLYTAPVRYHTNAIFSEHFILQNTNPTSLEFDGCTYHGSTPMYYTSLPSHCESKMVDCIPILVEKETGAPCEFRIGDHVSAVGK